MRRLTNALAGAATVAVLLAAPVAADVAGGVRLDPDLLQGTIPDSGDGGPNLVATYNPDPVEPGSSGSHWDTGANPNLLMEPFATGDRAVRDGLDLTDNQLTDIGWGEGTLAIDIFPFQAPESGFSDPTPFPGAPGNPATTVGEARANVVIAALSAYAGRFESDIPVELLFVWQPLPCSPTSGVLGAAGSLFVFADFPNAPNPDVWYPASLAEAIAGEPLNESIVDDFDNGGDMIAFFNTELGTEACLTTRPWSYSITEPAPPDTIDFFEVVIHEFGHAFGFQNFVNEAQGAFLAGRPDIFTTFAYDVDQGKVQAAMTEGPGSELFRSSRNFFGVGWNGQSVMDDTAAELEGGTPTLFVSSPPELEQTHVVQPASFGPQLPDLVTGDFACAQDGTGVSLDACEPLINPGEVAGKIVFAQRGQCSFVQKVANVEAAGGELAVIVNNRGLAPSPMGGDDPSIGIPSVGVGNAANNILEQICTNTLFVDGDDGDRFAFEVLFNSPKKSGLAQGAAITRDTGYFWFFNPDNVEVVAKALDGCDINDHFWVFAGGLTNVEVLMTVTDTKAGAVKQYYNPPMTPFQPIQDTRAFATCP